MVIQQRYETLILAVPEITQDETKNLETQLDRLIQAVKGGLLSFERWGKYKLIYPVRKNDYGVYFLVRFDVPKATTILGDIRSLFTIKLNDVVMRSMDTRLDLKQSLEYQRPKSLEEMPAAGDVNAFLKEHKMEGLLSSVHTAKRPVQRSQQAPSKASEQAEDNTQESATEG